MAVVVATLVVGLCSSLAASAASAQAKDCVSPAGRYEVTPPKGGAVQGADPAELAAASCQLGFHEDRTYPLSVIILCLLATAGTLAVVRRGTSYQPVVTQP